MVGRSATTAEVAAALGVSPATVQWHARRHRIPFDVTPGGHRRYDVAEVQAALGGPAYEVETELGRRRPGALGAGVDRPVSANALMHRDLRAARPESRPAAEGVTGTSAPVGSALAALVSHARHVALVTVRL